MARYKLLIEYDGRGFVGWQRQNNGPSIQQSLEQAIERFTGEHVAVIGAGRTDAGVHAFGQVAHFDLAVERSAGEVLGAVNYHLTPAAIAVLAVEVAEEDFHARLSAVGRRYRYRIVNRYAPLSLEAGRAWRISSALNAEAMDAAAQVLVGRHDFTSFRAKRCQAKSPLKTLDALSVTRTRDNIEIMAGARSFLHHQVRNMVGSLVLVGEGKWTRDDLAAALEARDRTAAGPCAPAEGLYLVAVRYD